MAIAIPGEVFTFQVLFLDVLGNPIVVPAATISVFTFDLSGTKVNLAPAGTAMSPVVGDAGRYVYVYPVPPTWTYQPTMYGVMQGIDPATATNIVTELDVDIVQSTASLTVLNNGVVVSTEVSAMNITGSGVTVTSPTPGSVDVVVPQALGRGLTTQFVKGG